MAQASDVTSMLSIPVRTVKALNAEEERISGFYIKSHREDFFALGTVNCEKRVAQQIVGKEMMREGCLEDVIS